LTDFTRATSAVLLARANAVYAGLNENPAYSNLPIPLTELRQAIDNYSAAEAAALDGGAMAKAHKNDMGDALTKMLRRLARHVEDHCNGDPTTLLSSGFQVATVTRTRTQPLSESIRRIEYGASGEFVVSLVAVPGVASYELRWAPVASGGTPGAWSSVLAAKSRPPISVAGLTPGASYMFQVRAVSGSGTTDWSDPITRVCA
jgi:hypothetical protein